MTKKDSCRGSKLGGYMKKSFKFLMKARDMYVQGMVEYSRNFVYVDTPAGNPTTGLQLYSVPRSFSVNSATARSNKSNGDFRQLIRAASHGISSGDRRVEFGAKAMKVPRSRGVGMGKIEEEEPCEVGNDITKPLLYPRSRSYAIGSGARMF